MERKSDLGKLEGEMNHERLWTLNNKLRVLGGGGMGVWVNLVVGIKEGMYCMEQLVWCINNESWNTGKIKLNLKNFTTELGYYPFCLIYCHQSFPILSKILTAMWGVRGCYLYFN